jgi:hypothetical protein
MIRLLSGGSTMKHLRRYVLAFALAAGAAVAVTPVAPAPVMAADAALDAEGMAALNTWWTALVAGTPVALGPVLAPEFQMMRTDGSGYDKSGYLASSLPKIAAIPEFTKVTFTSGDGLLIARYFVTVNETRDGKTLQKHAGRLTVFRKDGDKWLVVAHGNFATLDQ